VKASPVGEEPAGEFLWERVMEKKIRIFFGALAILIAAGVAGILILINEQSAYYNGAEYTADYQKLIKYPQDAQGEAKLHPNLKIIGTGSLYHVDAVIPWGVTTIEEGALYDGTYYFPETVVHLADSACYTSPGSQQHFIFPRRIDPKGSLLCCPQHTLDEWCEPYGVTANSWKAFYNRVYYFACSPEDSSAGISHMVTGWREIDGVRYYFDETGMLAEAELPEGRYQYGEAGFCVDQDGRVAFLEGWRQVNGDWFYFDEAGLAKTDFFTAIAGWFRGLWG